MIKIYFLTSAHFETCLWFRNDEDFKVAMNYVAIQAACFPQVTVLAFILMSNHVHFVLRGRLEDVIAFMNQFKHRYSLYFSLKYGVKELLRRNGVDIQLVEYQNDAIERTIAYVQMNSVAANICSHASQYPWGTGGTFFNPALPTGKLIGKMSKRARERLLHSEFDKLPDEWHLSDDGYINPKEYVDVSGVERLFKSPKRLNYFMNSSSKAKQINTSEKSLPAFRDQTLLATLPDLYKSLYQKQSFNELNPDQKSDAVKQIHYRFSSDANQIARVCGVTYAEAAHLLESL